MAFDAGWPHRSVFSDTGNKCAQPRCVPARMAELAASPRRTAKPHQPSSSPETFPVWLIYWKVIQVWVFFFLTTRNEAFPPTPELLPGTRGRGKRVFCFVVMSFQAKPELTRAHITRPPSYGPKPAPEGASIDSAAGAWQCPGLARFLSPPGKGQDRWRWHHLHTR